MSEVPTRYRLDFSTKFYMPPPPPPPHAHTNPRREKNNIFLRHVLWTSHLIGKPLTNQISRIDSHNYPHYYTAPHETIHQSDISRLHGPLPISLGFSGPWIKYAEGVCELLRKSC